MKLLTVIVNYKTPEMTLESAEAALREMARVPGGARLSIVDNGSMDGSFEKIYEGVKDKGWKPVTVLSTGWNGGFGYGNNFAIRHALASADPPDYVYLLNSDAFPDEGSIAALVEFMDTHPDVGIAGSYTHSPEGEPKASSFRFPTVFSEFEHAMRLGVLSSALESYLVSMPTPDHDVEVDWVSGSSLILRRDLLETVGLFDEGFFLYFEETDLCFRAKEQGWRTMFVRGASVTHIEGVSTGIHRVQRMPSYWFDSRRRFFEKNRGRAYFAAATAAHVGGGLVWRVRRRIQRKPAEDPPHFLRDLVRHALVR